MLYCYIMHCYGLPQHALGGGKINVASILFRCTFVLPQQYQALKHEAQPSVLGLDTTRIANFVNYFKNFTVYLSILTLIFSLQVTLAKKIGRKI